MTPAFLATWLFALSSVAAKRSVLLLGSSTANLVRIVLAALVLGLYAHTFGAGLHGVALGWFIASGLIGFGICDTAIFLALPLIGAQLTALMVQCLAAPIAAVTEWLWLGTNLGISEAIAGITILVGVGIALFPGKGKTPATRLGTKGIVLGLIAAAGQAIGAVLSRHGQLLSKAAGQPIDGMSVAYQRILAGVAFTLVWWYWQRRRNPPPAEPRPWRRAWPWIVANAVSGPSLGVACYQWAFQLQPTGVVMSITALTPLAVIPLAWWLDGERPTARSLSGGCVAVGGAIWLAASR
ncbi:MAG TPA: DMT family transporter [Candidatus Limnocylindria bacterium]|nr:DMT family transporter [Candidatus Limnocylindria bacterium]